MISRSVIPMGTSIRPVLVIFPVRAKTLVPLLLAVPMFEYHSGPLRMMGATLAKVSTLLIRVGDPQRPETAGYGGRAARWPPEPAPHTPPDAAGAQNNT